MRVLLLAFGGAFLLAGCCSTDNRGAAPREYYLTEGGSAYEWETEERPRDPRTGPWAEGWLRTGGPDRLTPSLGLDPLFPPAPRVQ